MYFRQPYRMFQIFPGWCRQPALPSVVAVPGSPKIQSGYVPSSLTGKPVFERCPGNDLRRGSLAMALSHDRFPHEQEVEHGGTPRKACRQA